MRNFINRTLFVCKFIDLKRADFSQVCSYWSSNPQNKKRFQMYIFIQFRKLKIVIFIGAQFEIDSFFLLKKSNWKMKNGKLTADFWQVEQISVLDVLGSRLHDITVNGTLNLVLFCQKKETYSFIQFLFFFF